MKSRRSLLITSIAMLMVATLSLGTATYAWFTNTTVATAENAQVTVSAPSGLEIAAVVHKAGLENAPTDGYAKTIYLDSLVNAELTPTSGNAQADDINFYTAEIDGDADRTVLGIREAATTEYIAIDIYGRLTAPSDDKPVNLTNISFEAVKLTSAGKVIRCAYYKATVVDDGESQTVNYDKLAYFDLDEHQDERSVKALTSTTTSEEAKFYANDNYVIENAAHITAEAIPLSVITRPTSVGTVPYTEEAGAKIGTLYFWVEGQDPSCNNANVKTVLGTVNKINITYNLA